MQDDLHRLLPHLELPAGLQVLLDQLLPRLHTSLLSGSHLVTALLHCCCMGCRICCNVLGVPGVKWGCVPQLCLIPVRIRHQGKSNGLETQMGELLSLAASLKNRPLSCSQTLQAEASGTLQTQAGRSLNLQQVSHTL